MKQDEKKIYLMQKRLTFYTLLVFSPQVGNFVKDQHKIVDIIAESG